MKRTDFDRLTELEATARLNDAVIETTKLTDLPNILNSDLTAGEVITLANVIEAIRSISEAGDTLAPSKLRAPSRDTEFRRTETNYLTPADVAQAYGTEEQEKSAAMTRLSALMSDLIPPDYEVPTVNGPVAFADIPKNDDGSVPKAWIDENCTCDEHEKGRIASDDAVPPAATGDDDSIARGMYL
jgi:hypothetical protein